MGNFRSFEHQKRGPSSVSPSFFTRSAHLFEEIPQASMKTIDAMPEQSGKRPSLTWNIADIPLYTNPAVPSSANTGISAMVGQRLPMRTVGPRSEVQPTLSPGLHSFATQIVQRRERNESREQNFPSKKNNSGLPEMLRVAVESRSGLSLDDVNVHYNSSRPAQVGALAYTQGTEIHVGPGQEQHLPHEAWHVIQQKEGRVSPRRQVGGALINDDEKLEQEADQFETSFMPGNVTIWPAAHSAPGERSNSYYPIQRKLWIGSKSNPVRAKAIESIYAAYTILLSTSNRSVQGIKKTTRNLPLYKALERLAYRGRELALLNLLKIWATDDIDEERTFNTWDEALAVASLYLNAEAETPEQRAANKRKLEELMADFSVSKGGRIKEENISPEERAKYSKEILPRLRRSASLGTDVFSKAISASKKRETPDTTNIPLPIERRKRHKAGESDLPGYSIHYRTFTEGTISPKPNAFVLGGSLELDYKPLLAELVKAIAIETGKHEKPFTDREVANLFLQEFAGKDAFATFSANIKKLAHKIVAIIFFAELSRHSIALLSAAATFYAVASREEGAIQPSLVGSFATGGEEMRPLFAGTGGPNLMRGEEVEKMTEKERSSRQTRATIDLLNYFNATKGKGEEDISTFVQRRTVEYILNLSQQTNQKLVYSALVIPELVRSLKHVYPDKSKTNNSLGTLTSLGFSYHPQPGDQNDCAIYTIYDQLTRVHGIHFGAHTRDEFVAYVRKRVGVPFGQMIDLTTHGRQLLQATQSFFTENLGGASPSLIIDVWSATGDGGVLEFQNVSQVDGMGAPYILTFYYNGVNHFDSLTGGPPRN